MISTSSLSPRAWESKYKSLQNTLRLAETSMAPLNAPEPADDGGVGDFAATASTARLVLPELVPAQAGAESLNSKRIGRVDKQIHSLAEAAARFRVERERKRGNRTPRLLLQSAYHKLRDIMNKRATIMARGEALLAAGHHQRAAAEFSKAIGLHLHVTERTKNASRSLVGRARAYLALKMIESCITDCRAALDSDPGSGPAHFVLFQAFSSLKMPADAGRSLRAAVRLLHTIPEPMATSARAAAAAAAAAAASPGAGHHHRQQDQPLSREHSSRHGRSKERLPFDSGTSSEGSSVADEDEAAGAEDPREWIDLVEGYDYDFTESFSDDSFDARRGMGMLHGTESSRRRADEVARLRSARREDRETTLLAELDALRSLPNSRTAPSPYKKRLVQAPPIKARASIRVPHWSKTLAPTPRVTTAIAEAIRGTERIDLSDSDSDADGPRFDSNRSAHKPAASDVPARYQPLFYDDYFDYLDMSQAVAKTRVINISNVAAAVRNANPQANQPEEEDDEGLNLGSIFNTPKVALPKL
jgi:tetratricopeptide (TPR) repeat protein